MAALPGSVAPFDFVIKQGTDESIVLTFYDDNGALVDLTNYAMALSICPLPGAAPFLTLSSAAITGSRIILGGVAATAQLFFAHADTGAFVASGLPLPNPCAGSALVYKLGSYDLKFTDPTGLNGYFFEGTTYLDPRNTA